MLYIMAAICSFCWFANWTIAFYVQQKAPANHIIDTRDILNGVDSVSAKYGLFIFPLMGFIPFSLFMIIGFSVRETSSSFALTGLNAAMLFYTIGLLNVHWVTK